MSCSLTMTLISESQEGNIGEDWKYDLQVEVVNEALKSEARVSVPKHNLQAGVVLPPHGNPPPQVIFEGDCKSQLLLRMHLKATEVDLFVNDVGKVHKELTIDCPGPAGGTVTKETDIAVSVRESPSIFPKTAVFTLRVRFQLHCG